MSRGLGWVQRACLRVIHEHEEEANGGKPPTAYNIAATVYHVEPDEDGNRWINDAQHAAIRRALKGLQRQGCIIGFRDAGLARDPPFDGRTQLANVWMTEKRAQKFVTETLKRARNAARLGLNGAFEAALAKRVMKKMRAIGMKVS